MMRCRSLACVLEKREERRRESEMMEREMPADHEEDFPERRLQPESRAHIHTQHVQPISRTQPHCVCMPVLASASLSFSRLFPGSA